ncbi:MAG: T9SS type A sorting domain-containing protein [Bacteroidetes bacterium]|nr:T9SS type A sorting domain-containing protein [Bacteroidota bacterium]
MTVFSAAGSIVFKENFNGTDFRLSSEGIGSGYYFIRLKDSKGTIIQTMPLIIQ